MRRIEFQPAAKLNALDHYAVAVVRRRVTSTEA